MPTISRFTRLCLILAAFLLLVGLRAWLRKTPVTRSRQTPAEAPASLALQNPLFVGAVADEPCPGVTHWTRRVDSATFLDLVRFDFDCNPRLRLELFDQDAHDAAPFDNRVRFWPLGVGRAAKLLNRHGHGPVLAAWNGSFFSPQKQQGELVAHHIAPVVLNGVAHYLETNHRWTVGVRYDGGAPIFSVLHCPDRATMERHFTFAVGGVQCLIRGGAPLQLPRRPRPGKPALPRPVPSTCDEVGAIPGNDFAHASRTSLAWTTDPLWLYVLIVKAFDPGRGRTRVHGRSQGSRGGWTLRDLQEFWRSLHVAAAVNLDGGDVTQMICRRSDGRWDLVPPRSAAPVPRTILPPEYVEAPAGGSLTYFYVRMVEE